MEAKEVVIFSAAVRALIRALGMQSVNHQREIIGASPAYMEADFDRIIQDEAIGANQVLSYLFQGN
jgi:hypothetical protein